MYGQSSGQLVLVASGVAYAGDIVLLGVGAGGVGGDGSQHLRSDTRGLEGGTSDGRGERPRRKSGQHDWRVVEEKRVERESERTTSGQVVCWDLSCNNPRSFYGLRFLAAETCYRADRISLIRQRLL